MVVHRLWEKNLWILMFDGQKLANLCPPVRQTGLPGKHRRDVWRNYNMFGLGRKSDQSSNTFTSFDEEVHTPANPYCSNVQCWCHTNVTYHAEVQRPVVTEEEIDVAYNFFSIPRKRR